jgi:hypothetical protein
MSKKTSRRSQKGGKRSHKRASRRSSKKTSRKTKRNQKGGKQGKVTLINKKNEAQTLILEEQDILRAKQIKDTKPSDATDPVKAAVEKVLNMSSFFNYDSMKVDGEFIQAVYTVRGFNMVLKPPYIVEPTYVNVPKRYLFEKN